MDREIELKFLIPPEAAEAILGALDGEGAVRQLDATYYDTADHALRRAGFGLRVRDGEGGRKQTLKSASAGGVFSRGEWEETIAGPAPDRGALARTPVAVVCAGAKSILDLGLTLEYLETHGVPVLSIGQDNFAAFFTPDSGLKADFRMDGAEEQARFIRAKWQLGLAGGVVVSNPVPAQQAMPREEIDAITAQARHLFFVVIANIITGKGKPRRLPLAALGEQSHHGKGCH